LIVAEQRRREGVKRVRDPIVEKLYEKGHDSYHRDTGEGADFYDVGQTLGAGGTAIWRNDSLYRAWNFKSQRIIANGPVRAIFELQYQPWDAAGLRVTETTHRDRRGPNLNHVTSIFRADRTFRGPPGW
jgi:pectinesterase